MKSEQEAPSGTLVIQGDAEWLAWRMVIECSPVRNLNSNGMLEQIVMSVKELVRQTNPGNRFGGIGWPRAFREKSNNNLVV